MLAVPENGSVHALIRISNSKKLSIVGGVKTLEMLIMTNRENEVCLHHN